MVKILIKGTKEITNKIYKELQVYGDIRVRQKTEDTIIVECHGCSLMDETELSFYNFVHARYKILKILKLSRSFIDIHNVEKTKEFQDNFNLIQKKIEPFYVVKKHQWWIGIKDIDPDKFNLVNVIKHINRIGVGCGLVPKSII